MSASTMFSYVSIPDLSKYPWFAKVFSAGHGPRWSVGPGARYGCAASGMAQKEKAINSSEEVRYAAETNQGFSSCECLSLARGFLRLWIFDGRCT